MYPEIAVRELLANAIIHQDFEEKDRLKFSRMIIEITTWNSVNYSRDLLMNTNLEMILLQI
jgi:hypothetical protein